MAVAGHQPRRAALDPDQHPVAVELDLADPAAPSGRASAMAQSCAGCVFGRAPRTAPGAGGVSGGWSRRLLPGWAERDLRLQRERVDARPLVFVVPLDEEPGCRSRSRRFSRTRWKRPSSRFPCSTNCRSPLLSNCSPPGSTTAG